MIRTRDHHDGWPSALLVATATLLLLACSGTPGKDLPVTEGKASVGAGGAQEISVAVESYYFNPSRIHVAVGVPVRLNLKSGTFIIPHDFSIHAPEAGINVDQDIGHGKNVTVEFTPTKVGEYKFYCDKKGHAMKGIVGTLVVEAKW